MVTATKKCRVCGKEYEACHSAKRVDGVFRYKDVACSPACGSIYLDRIRASRAKKQDEVAVVSVDEAFALYEEEYMDDLYDDEFDEEFDDNEEPEIEV